MAACSPGHPRGFLTLGRSSFLRATASSLASYSACTWSLFFSTLCGRQKGEACNTEFTRGPPRPQAGGALPHSSPHHSTPSHSPVLLGQSGCSLTRDMDSGGSRGGGGRAGEPFSETGLCRAVILSDTERDRNPEKGKCAEWCPSTAMLMRGLDFPSCRENSALSKCGAWQVTTQDIL